MYACMYTSIHTYMNTHTYIYRERDMYIDIICVLVYRM